MPHAAPHPVLRDKAHGPDANGWHPVKNWDALVKSGASFFGAKATEGNTVTDKTLAHHRDGARQQPFTLVVYYHFARLGDPRTQAQRFADKIGPLRANERLCLDFETPWADGVASLDWIDEFFFALQPVCGPRRPLIYTSARIWDMIDDPAWDLATEIDLWAPRYSGTSLKEPRIPKPWKAPGWTFWQFTDSYDTPGIDKCDYNVFCSDKAALEKYAAGGASI
jgi:GH25 family lysozyme M1 (1,4-beta-N-acetylmuramidase)